MGQKPSTPDTSVSPERNNGQSPRNMAEFTFQPSPDIPEDEQSPPYEYPSEQREWNDYRPPAWPQDDKNEEKLPRPNPFIFGGAIPVDLKPKNVILFGETGVGKSSVINLMAGAEVALTSSTLEGCTMHATEYSFLLNGEMPIRVYDTVGLSEPQMGVNSFLGAVEKAYKLITSLRNAGGIDLLLFCVRGNRITATLQGNYRLFFEILCEKKIPLAFVVTNLEYEDPMEDWWKNNEQTFRNYNIQSVAHACITAVPARVTMLARKREESRHTLQRMLHGVLSRPNASSPYVEDTRSWFRRVVDSLWSFVMKNSWIKKKVLTYMLQTRCSFSPEDARKFADMFTRKP